MPDTLAEPEIAADTTADLPGLAPAEAALRLLRGLALGGGVAMLLLAVALAQGGAPIWREARRSGVLALPLAALLLAFAGVLATLVLARARRRALLPPLPAPPARRWRRGPRPAATGDADAIGRAARWPQALIVAPLALLAAIVALAGRPVSSVLLAPAAAGYLVGGAMLALAFLMLVAERIVAAQPAARLPEAADLRALLMLPVLCWPAAGLLQIAASLGARFTAQLGDVLALLIALAGAELASRALGVLFLPPPEPDAARAAVRSLLARLLSRGARGGLATPIREQFGIDFSRSWALLFVRAALPPLALLLLLAGWGLSGIVLVPLDQRAVYERFGAPAGVLPPGLHAILPWPLGTVRRVDFGVVRTLPLVAADLVAPPVRVAAEDIPPPGIDRLWEQAHPGEAEFLIASASAGRQSFQSVSADVRVLWRVGLDDAAAYDAAYRTVAPDALLRAATGRVAAAFFAGRTLDAVLGENREAMADRLRAAVQRDLDRFGAGIQVLAVVLEAIHPPAGAADAYHNVQSAEISANATISAERGRAAAARAGALQFANELTAGAAAAAAETTGGAIADATRFAADHAAAAHGGPSFLLDRYFTAVVAALGRTHLTILDNRIDAADAPVLDLRPPGAASMPGGPSATE